MKRIAIPSSAVLLFTLVFATPALAAVPSNDAFAGRTVIAALPYTQTLDTSEATSDTADAELRTQCGAPALDASVWYELTAPADMAVIVDVSASDYSAGVVVATGSPGAFGRVVACGPSSVVFFAEGGTTYVVLVFDHQEDGGGNGGMLELSMAEAPPPPEIDLAIDSLARFNPKSGSVTLTGTVTCTAGAFAFIDASVSQRVGRFIVRGFGFAEAPCDGSVQALSIEVLGDSGLFKGGTAVASAFAQACDFECGFASVETNLRLRR